MTDKETCELQALRAGENLLLNVINDYRDAAKSGKEIVQSWLKSAAEHRLHIGQRELTAEENELIAQVLQCILADFIAFGETPPEQTDGGKGPVQDSRSSDAS